MNFSQNGKYIALGVSVIALLIAASSRWPYFFYVLLRIMVCAASIDWCRRVYGEGRFVWVWVFGSVALIFNPLFPLHMGRPNWQVLNLLAAGFFTAWIGVSLLRERKTSADQEAGTGTFSELGTMLSHLGVMGGVVVYVALAIGALTIFFLALNFLAAIANLLAGISLLLLIPLLLVALISRRARRVCGNGTILASFILGASTWLTATVYLNDIWGKAAVIVGVLFFGIGSVPLGCLALLLHGKFGVLFMLIGQLVLVYVLRILGFWIESKASVIAEDFSTPDRKLALSPTLVVQPGVHSIFAADEAEHWLQKGRSFYDLAGPSEWNPEEAAECFERGLRVMPDNRNLHVYLKIMYQDGDGVPQDYSRAFAHFSAAADLGDSNAQRSLVKCMKTPAASSKILQEHFIGIERQPSKAMTSRRRL